MFLGENRTGANRIIQPLESAVGFDVAWIVLDDGIQKKASFIQLTDSGIGLGESDSSLGTGFLNVRAAVLKQWSIWQQIQSLGKFVVSFLVLIDLISLDGFIAKAIRLRNLLLTTQHFPLGKAADATGLIGLRHTREDGHHDGRGHQCRNDGAVRWLFLHNS